MLFAYILTLIFTFYKMQGSWNTS